MWREEQPETDRDLKRYGARLLNILEAPLPCPQEKPTNLSRAPCR